MELMLVKIKLIQYTAYWDSEDNTANNDVCFLAKNNSCFLKIMTLIPCKQCFTQLCT